MNEQLSKQQKSLAVFHGHAAEIFEKLVQENNIESVYSNHDYEPYARKRDLEIFKILKNSDIGFNTYKDQVIFEKSEVVKEDNAPYVVYTPYSKKWKQNFNKEYLNSFKSEDFVNNISNHSYPFMTLKDIGFETSKIKVATFDVSPKLISNYEQIRNFPALAQTSLLGPHLRFGAVSIRKIVGKALEEKDETFLNELIWRDFYQCILWHFPHVGAHKAFKPEYESIEWRNNEKEFEMWCKGETGYPIVDAGMRQLNQTGFMHNRVRMIVASFLSKHLLIDWRWGEAYFAEKLLDFDLASNNGGWQWAAGSGCDAAPYFRIFNPYLQTKKFDPELKYIKKWVPEFQELSYPPPIVVHEFARKRCLEVYSKALRANK